MTSFQMALAAVTISVTVGIAFIGFVFWAGNWYGKVNSDRESFKEFMKYVHKRLDDIFDRLPNPLTDSASPLSLTELGEKISLEIGARDWASRNLASARQATDGMSPYKTQQHCFDLAKLENLTEDEKQKVENAAFEHGLTVSQILDVPGIELRDLLLTRKEKGSGRTTPPFGARASCY